MGHIGLALAIAWPEPSTRSPGAPHARHCPVVHPGALAWLRSAGISAGLCLLLAVVTRFAPAAGRLAEARAAAVIIGSTTVYVAAHAALGAEEVRLARSALVGRWRRTSLRRGKRR